MAENSDAALNDGERWNYFNYFTEIEEHFQRARGTGLFLLSPLDWALIENWKNAGIPLEAVLRGIDAAFVKWHARKRRFGQVNSIAYCAQAVQEEADAIAKGESSAARGETKAPFSLDELEEHIRRAVAKLADRPEYAVIVESLAEVQANLEEHYKRLEQLEQHLTTVEDRMSAIARTAVPQQVLLDARKELDSTLKPYRSKMTAPQLALLERQYLDKWLLDHSSLPRLSLFYIG